MIHPASDKRVALSVSAGEALQQGSVLKFTNMPDGTGRLQAFKATNSGDIVKYGTFLAYYITPDSQDIEFVGAPESTAFALNSATGIGGGTNTIASGAEFVALGGRGTLIRIDANSLNGTPTAATLAGAEYQPGKSLKVNATSGLLDTQSGGSIHVDAALVIDNDTRTLVVMLA